MPGLAVPILTTPTYRDMSAQLAGAREVWDRQRDMLCTAAMFEPTQQPMPFTAADHVPIGAQENELDRLVRSVAIAVITWLAVLAVMGMIRRAARSMRGWKANR